MILSFTRQRLRCSHATIGAVTRRNNPTTAANVGVTGSITPHVSILEAARVRSEDRHAVSKRRTATF